MRWKIKGLDKETGDPRQVWVESHDREGALELASGMGIVVSSVVVEEPEQIVHRSPQPVVISGPVSVVLDKRQFKALRVTDARIAWGVVLGLTLWSILGVVVTVMFWGLIIGAFAAAAGP